MSVHPFESADAFEAAIAPYMELPKPRHIRSFLFCGGSFRARLLHAGVALMESYEYRQRSKHPRLKFAGSFRQFLRKVFGDMASCFDAEDYFAPEHREIAHLYGVALPDVQAT